METPHPLCARILDSVAQSFVPQSPGTVDIGGRLLDPQQGLQYEGGVKVESFGGRLLTTASVYHIRKDNVALSDLVLFNQTGQIAFFPGVAERSGVLSRLPHPGVAAEQRGH